MESEFSLLSSSKGEFKAENYIQPHYKEAYRLAIDCLVKEGEASYRNFIKEEGICGFLSEGEIGQITESAVQPPTSNHSEEVDSPQDDTSSTGTYWPTHSDTDPPNLDLGWPDVPHRRLETSIDLLFHPPKQNSPTIKEVIRKQIQDARQVIAIAMDIFTDVDIFKEVVDASVRGVPVYILLDHNHFKSFLNMVENQDIQIQKLRNMRIRTVKGQEYCCRSGVKFHGGMGQTFFLADCQKVFFGSYSFMWSYEKINLSMVQVITGQLVETYDEEFRTLYARSTVPAQFQTASVNQCETKPNGKMDGYLIHSSQPFERKDHLRHTLDAVYRQTCERRSGFSALREVEERPLVTPHARFLQDTSEFYKRHSYAGEQQEPVYLPKLPKYGTSNWNVAAESNRYGGFSNNVDKQYESYVINPMFRGSNMRQSYHGHDKQVQNMRQNLPSLASTSKSFLRTWRIESYLNNNNDPPYGENYDYLDQFEENKMAPPQHSRIRSSVVFTSTIPEQPETNSYSNNSASFNHDLARIQSNAHMYSSTLWNQTAQHDDYMLKRCSLQILENSGSSTTHGSGQDAIYASLNRAKNIFANKEHDYQQEDRYKRHSVADPRCNTYNSDLNEPSNNMYASLPIRQKICNMSANENPRNEAYTPNFKEDQRSVSHHDFKKADESTSTSGNIWQEPPSRTVSATLLDTEDSQPSKPNSASSQRFLKKSTKKIKSLLNIPQKGDSSPKGKNSESLKMGSSTDTILSDYDDTAQGKKSQDSTANSTKSVESSRLKQANGKISGAENHSPGLAGEASAPRFITEELHPSHTPASAETSKTQEQSTVVSQNEKTDSTLTRSDLLSKQQVSANRLYSRFEPLCSFESRLPTAGQPAAQSHVSEKTRNSVFLRRQPMNDHSTYTNQQTQGHDNRIGRFIQRVGNLIHKNKY
ncbi:protein FAM83B-like [Sinocyclocheilus anshuiensis]|uniref:Protein FAM83B-like n=1 Tax=Sinocyclocheilus anshuiensis TaxID=1608454 RepID=A0A671KM33_9TELE|nr:PREDICTED: protein FAM83B-like [Sinocyclocheilus anshuiensis]